MEHYVSLISPSVTQLHIHSFSYKAGYVWVKKKKKKIKAQRVCNFSRNNGTK